MLPPLTGSRFQPTVGPVGLPPHRGKMAFQHSTLSKAFTQVAIMCMQAQVQGFPFQRMAELLGPLLFGGKTDFHPVIIFDVFAPVVATSMWAQMVAESPFQLMAEPLARPLH